MSDDKQPRVTVTSDSGGNLGMILVAVILVVGIIAAVWFFNQSRTAEETTGVTVDLETGEADPGTESTIVP